MPVIVYSTVIYIKNHLTPFRAKVDRMELYKKKITFQNWAAVKEKMNLKS